MCHSNPSILSLIPVLRFAVLMRVRRDYLPFEHHCLYVEVIILANTEKPDLFRTVFPMRLRTPTLFAFPCDPILRQKILLPDAMNRRRASPVTADVNRRIRLQYSHGLRQPPAEPFRVFVHGSLT